MALDVSPGAMVTGVSAKVNSGTSVAILDITRGPVSTSDFRERLHEDRFFTIRADGNDRNLHTRQLADPCEVGFGLLR